MAKSDSDSNGLRQDQPECASQREAGRRVTHNEVCCYRIKLGTPISYRSGVTELPGLTSDPILAADRRGGILISFGPNRRPYRVINPSSWPRFLVRCGREIDSDRTALAYHPSARLHLRASERTNAGSAEFGWICNRHFDGVHRDVFAVRRE